MLIQCPSCRTTYTVSENLITTPNPTFRCSRCKHIFVVGLKSEAKSFQEGPTPASLAGGQEEENREFSFSFPSQKKPEQERQEIFDSLRAKEVPFTEKPEEKKLESAELQAAEPFSIPKDAPPFAAAEEQTSAGTHEKIASHLTQEGEDSWSIRWPNPPNEAPFIISDESRSLQTESAADGPPEFEQSAPALEDRVTPFALEPQHDQRLSTLPYLSLFGCLLLAFSLLTFVHQVQPRSIDKFIKGIPWFGAAVFRNNHLRHGIALQSIRPSIQKIQGNREVFVVSGIAANDNSTSVREVRIEGRVYSAEGKEIERQTMTVGNAISEKIIRDMTTQELSIIQKSGPLKRFGIAPEESANFVIVFLKPTKEIKKFTCRVVSAEEPT